jgi:hypothetical protein
MTRTTTHGPRRVANRIPRGGHGAAVDGNRAANTFRRRYRASAPSPPPPRRRLIDRITYEDGSQLHPVLAWARGEVTQTASNIHLRADTREQATRGSGLFFTQDYETQSSTQGTKLPFLLSTPI